MEVYHYYHGTWVDMAAPAEDQLNQTLAMARQVTNMLRSWVVLTTATFYIHG
jgi:protein tyrosine phosphatase